MLPLYSPKLQKSNLHDNDSWHEKNYDVHSPILTSCGQSIFRCNFYQVEVRWIHAIYWLVRETPIALPIKDIYLLLKDVQIILNLRLFIGWLWHVISVAHTVTPVWYVVLLIVLPEADIKNKKHGHVWVTLLHLEGKLRQERDLCKILKVDRQVDILTWLVAF